MNIRSLAKKGHSQRQIARLTGLNRKTVRKYLQDGEIPVYKQLKRESLLRAYQGLIEGWLEQQDYQASRIHELLQNQGFKGSYDLVQRYVKRVKEQRDQVAYTRFETMPGQQAQVDFADFQVQEPDGTIKTIYVFVMALGYSRHKYVEFIEDCTLSNFLACHQNAFGFFGGIPAEILYDNMKNVLIKRLIGKIQWNKEFEAFCIHYGFKPLVAPPYAPWVKGKVERPIGYVRNRFWAGYTFIDIKQANHDVRVWINTVAKERIHGTHRQKVAERYETEQSYLGPIPAQTYDISAKAYRKVYKDCTVSFDANRYVVAHELVGKRLLLRVRNGIIRIYDDDRWITTYQIPEGKGHLVQHPWFYERLRNDKEQIRRKYRKPFGKVKATRGLLKDGLRVEVMARPLAEYELEVI